MAFFRKAGNILGKTVSNQISQEISSSKTTIFQAIRFMSTSKLFIGGLSYSTDDTSLREAFNKYGEVSEARVIVDRETGRSRGFGFITYSSIDEASAAIQALDQQELHGRRIRVDYANDRARGFGGGGYGGGNYGGGGGYDNNNDGYGGNYGGGGYGRSSNFNSGISYRNGTGPQGSGGNYASNNGYGGAGGSDDFSSGGAAAGSSGYGGFGIEQPNNDAGVDGGDNEYTPDNYADRRS